MPRPYTSPVIPSAFHAKKSRILADLATPDAEYLDKSPKGSVDIGVRDLISEINAYDGLVTTSSCAGRVSVFVEGRKSASKGDGHEVDGRRAASATGKGGGKWLFVSHDPVDLPAGQGESEEDVGRRATQLVGLVPPAKPTAGPSESGSHLLSDAGSSPRLVRLSFEPLILHVLCASLVHARPLLAAAISAGFRESGVQSLKNLEDEDACPMVAVRSAGLGFETVLGWVKDTQEPAALTGENGTSGESYEAAVSGDYIYTMLRIANGRFVENESRRDRFRGELNRAMAREMDTMSGSVPKKADSWEEADERRARKRAEGLQKQAETKTHREAHIDKEANGHKYDLDSLMLS